MSIKNLGNGIYDVTLYYGFMEEADVPEALSGIIDFRDEFLAQPADVRFAEGLEIVLAGIEGRLAAHESRT